MAYDEAPYQVMHQGDNFEIRFYDERIVIQTSFQGSNSGFQKLFKYISGNNQSSTKIEMTTPVTMLPDQGQMVMQFFLPARFDEGYFAVIQYSGFASDKNFLKHAAILKKSLDEAQIEIKGPAVKATYNGPFTLPHLRRNEAMYLVHWE